MKWIAKLFARRRPGPASGNPRRIVLVIDETQVLVRQGNVADAADLKTLLAGHPAVSAAARWQDLIARADAADTLAEAQVVFEEAAGGLPRIQGAMTDLASRLRAEGKEPPNVAEFARLPEETQTPRARRRDRP